MSKSHAKVKVILEGSMSLGKVMSYSDAVVRFHLPGPHFLMVLYTGMCNLDVRNRFFYELGSIRFKKRGSV